MTLQRCLAAAALVLVPYCCRAEAPGGETLSCVPDAAWPRKPAEFTWGAVPGLTVDKDDQVYVFTRAQPAVQVYRPDGALVRSWTVANPQGAHFVRIDPAGNVWLTDYRAHVVQKYTPEGKLLLTLGESGRAGDGATHFNGPTDVAFLPAGDVFVSDGYGNRRVVHFDAQGRYVKHWGEEGDKPGQFFVTKDDSLLAWFVQPGIGGGNLGFWFVGRTGIAAAVCQLQHFVRFYTRLLIDQADERPEIRQILFVQPQLARIRPTVRDHSCRFNPDQAGASGCKTLITPDRQRVRAAPRSSVTTLHRLDSQAVGCSPPADRNWHGQHRQVGRQRQIQTAGFQVACQIGQAAVIKATVGPVLNFYHDIVLSARSSGISG